MVHIVRVRQCDDVGITFSPFLSLEITRDCYIFLKTCDDNSILSCNHPYINSHTHTHKYIYIHEKLKQLGLYLKYIYAHYIHKYSVFGKSCESLLVFLGNSYMKNNK